MRSHSLLILKNVLHVYLFDKYSSGVWRSIKDFWGQKWYSVEVGF